MTEQLQKIVQSSLFQNFILLVILVAAVLVGLETYPTIMAEHAELLHVLNNAVLWIFAAEAAVKMAQYGKQWHRYFVDPWNLFDFTIVVVCFLPVNASYAAVLRLARIMRAMRLMTALPQLQLIVGALIKSIPSMGYVGILLSLHFYVYAVMGVFLFRDNDPVHFEALPTAMLSLFRVVTLEDWTDIMYIQMLGSDVYGGAGAYINTTGVRVVPSAMPVVGACYFVSFVMFGTMVMLNLFIGVILNSMDDTRHERELEAMQAKRAAGKLIDIDDEVDNIEQQLTEAIESLNDLRIRLETRQAVDANGR